MPDYVVLYRFTNKGLESIKNSPDRLKAWKKMVSDAGARIKENYVLLGQYDIMEVIEAPNDETIAKLSLQLSALGNVHAESHRAFSETQYLDIVSKLNK